MVGQGSFAERQGVPCQAVDAMELSEADEARPVQAGGKFERNINPTREIPAATAREEQEFGTLDYDLPQGVFRPSM
jgi:hypothetical protein